MRRTFVVGCPRSGTTIVQAMLARHPAVFTLPETGFFTHLHGNTAWRWGDAHEKYRRARWRQRLGFSRKHERNLFMTLQRMLSSTPASSLRPSLRMRTLEQRFITLLDQLALENGRELWLEKTPNHLLFIPEIEALVPDACFVHVIRPGMDVLASLADASLLFEHDNAFGGGTVHWARRWNRAMQIHRTHMARPQHYLLFLDDLIEHPEREWQRLCGFLDIAADAPLKDACTQLIADLEQEPWKRRAIHGHLRLPDSKVDGLFGPKLQRWLQTRLASYDDLRAHHMQTRGEDAFARREQPLHTQHIRKIAAKSAGG
ncbi:Sulfotransferase family protein [Dyella sp. OK004]|uniref:sulfotransferase family protein n=1 Tax=Dyella sp. OK004 TaxID=1855292 RepID=UPI0008EE974C|nr:sulfotransferase [Dyella sp. OK004]SFS08783.1 Sulfotransferase family protein [Dyella sp. OK004]